jgi:tetratricopeptide (TPR) repeat protein
MRSERKRIQPYKTGDGNYKLLLDFARQVVTLLDASFDPPENWHSESIDDEPWAYERIIRYQGNEQGFKILHNKEYEPRAGGQAVDQVVVTTYGLPEGIALELECTRSWYDPRFIEIRVTGPAQAVDEVLQSFEREFGGKLPLEDSEIENTLSKANSSTRARAWSSAEIYARMVLEVDPQNSEALFYMGVARAAQGDLQNGEKYLLAAIELNPDYYDAWYNLGLIYMNRKEPEKGMEAFKRSLEIKPDNHPVLYQLGRALESLGQVDAALDAYRDVVRTSPNPDGYWHYTGMDLTDHAKEAITRLEKAKPSLNDGKKQNQKKNV